MREQEKREEEGRKEGRTDREKKRERDIERGILSEREQERSINSPDFLLLNFLASRERRTSVVSRIT